MFIENFLIKMLYFVKLFIKDGDYIMVKEIVNIVYIIFDDFLKKYIILIVY